MSVSKRTCVIIFDVMSFKRTFICNEKVDWIKVVDLDNLERRGIYSAWKIPISYFICQNGVSWGELKNIFIEYLQLCVALNVTI